MYPQRPTFSDKYGKTWTNMNKSSSLRQQIKTYILRINAKYMPEGKQITPTRSQRMPAAKGSTPSKTTRAYSEHKT